MEALRLILLFAHLVGFALLLGGGITQYLSGQIRINQAMVRGAIVQLVTGPALVAVVQAGQDKDVDGAKLAVKGVIAVVIFVMVFFSRKRDEVNKGHFLAIIGLTLLNAAVAVFWR